MNDESDRGAPPPLSPPVIRYLFSKACLQHSQTVIQPCMWLMEETSQFSMGQAAQGLTCSIMEKQHTGLYDCLRLLQACFRKGMSACDPLGGGGLGLAQQKQQRPKVVVAVVSRIRSGKNIPDGPLSESDMTDL